MYIFKQHFPSHINMFIVNNSEVLKNQMKKLSFYPTTQR